MDKEKIEYLKNHVYDFQYLFVSLLDDLNLTNLRRTNSINITNILIAEMKAKISDLENEDLQKRIELLREDK